MVLTVSGGKVLAYSRHKYMIVRRIGLDIRSSRSVSTVPWRLRHRACAFIARLGNFTSVAFGYLKRNATNHVDSFTNHHQ